MTSGFAFTTISKRLPSSFLPLFLKGSQCITCHMEMSFIQDNKCVRENLFPYETLCSKTRFETEAKQLRHRQTENCSLFSLLSH